MKAKSKVVLLCLTLLVLLWGIEGMARNEKLPAIPVTSYTSGGSFPICTAPGNQSFTKLAYNSEDNEYLIVWMDYREEGKTSVYGQRVSAAGKLLGDNFPITTDSSERAVLPFPCYSPEHNEYLVVYAKILPSGDWNIHGRFRNGVLARSAWGREYIEFYYRNAAEISSLLQGNPLLKQAATSLVKTLLPFLKLMVEGKVHPQTG